MARSRGGERGGRTPEETAPDEVEGGDGHDAGRAGGCPEVRFEPLRRRSCGGGQVAIQQKVVDRHRARVARARDDTGAHLAQHGHERLLGGANLDQLIPPETRRADVDDAEPEPERDQDSDDRELAGPPAHDRTRSARASTRSAARTTGASTIRPSTTATPPRAASTAATMRRARATSASSGV